MKRSEMVDRILMWYTNYPGEDFNKVAASDLLAELEKAGMLPPLTGDTYVLTAPEWEPETEG